MRYHGLFLLLVLLFPALCGCLQQASEPAPPSPTVNAIPSPFPPSTPVPLKEINVTAWKDEHEVIVQYHGGKDAAGLLMFRVQIDNRDGNIVKTPIYSPEIGRQYPFPYVGIVNPNTINIIGVFNDGTEQTVLMKYF
jgi:hypothetical protein